MTRSDLVTLGALLTVAAPGWAAPIYHSTTDILACGGAEATLHSACTSSEPRRCLAQKLVVQTPLHQHVATILVGATPSDSMYLVQSWACVTSDAGQSYFLLDYVCVPGRLGCTDEDQREEWQQLFDRSGRNLDAGHGLREPGHERALSQAGLTHLMDPPGVQMHALGFTVRQPAP